MTIIKKRLWRKGVWEDVKFIKMPLTKDMEEWCKSHYSKPGQYGYQQCWVKNFNFIIMEERVYTHWKLCE